MLHQCDLSWLQTGCVGHPFQPTPVTNILCVILHKDIGKGPLSEVTEGHPKGMGVLMFPSRSLTCTATSFRRVLAMMRSKSSN